MINKFAIFMVLFFSFPALAKEKNHSSYPLSQYKPAGSSCDKDIKKSKLKVKKTRKQKFKYNCDISVKQLNNLLSNKFLVDVRTAQEFNMYNIPNSNNMSIASIKYKNFLKNKDIVLVGTGDDDSFLINACNDLLGSGFKNVKVLLGGIRYWHAKGYLVDGRPPASKQLLVLDTAMAWRMAQDRNVLFILDKKNSPLKKHISKYQVVEAWSSRKVQSIVSSQIKDLKAVVLASNNSSKISLNVDIPVYSYKPLLSNFLNEKQTQLKILKAKENGPKKPPCDF